MKQRPKADGETRSGAAERVLLKLARRLAIGRLELTLPSGRQETIVGRQDGPGAALTVRRLRLVRRLLTAGANGFAEGYMAGDCDTPDLEALLRLAALNEAALADALSGRWYARLLHRVQHRLKPNTRAGSKRNIHAHYDLGNQFYRQWLDPTMTYSSAVFPRGGEDLTQAQLNKYRLICDAAAVQPGSSLLEIGCGWGGFASYAARERGARVTAITISDAQHEVASRRIFEEGLGERVAILKQDYRDTQGRYDAVASIEMFEAVGERYWPAFFAKVKDVLKPGGQAGLQIITIQDGLFQRYRRSADFIQRHIFPGGMLPSPAALLAETRRAGLAWLGDHGFALDYARTLRTWRERFQSAWEAIQPLGFDERFRRLWTYYLSYCEAGFRTGRIDLRQIALRA